MEILSKSPDETKKLAFRIASELKGGEVLALYGNLGSGKTTFVQGLVEAFGIKGKVLSPTFVLVRHYKVDSKRTVNHIDLYRITDVEEVLNLGITDMFYDANSITVVEWPEVIESHLPQNTKRIRFEVINEFTRKITYV